MSTATSPTKQSRRTAPRPVLLSDEVIAALDALIEINQPACRSEIADAVLRKALHLPPLDA